jgi:outer membrane murein-binding lipoprotein Lpp
MAYAFDTLGYARRLRDAGVTLPEAEDHAEAARDFVMAELVTRNDVDVAITAVRNDLAARHRDLETSVAAVRRDLEFSVAAVRHDLNGSVTSLREEMAGIRRDVRAALDNMGLRLTIRPGAMPGVCVAILVAIIKL